MYYLVIYKSFLVIKNDEITLRVCYQLLEMFLKMIGLTLIYNEEEYC